MLRYCTNCKKDYDFAPLAVSGKDDLICPECGMVIDKNSRNPEDKIEAEKTEAAIGNTAARLLHLSYIFFMTMGIIGVIGFITGIRPLLIAATAISLTVFIIMFLTGTLVFVSGLILVPMGAVLGYLYFKSIDGACLVIHIVFLLRHLIRDIILRLIFRFIGFASGC